MSSRLKKKNTCLVRPNVSLKTLASVNSVIFLLFGMKVLVRGGFFGAGLNLELHEESAGSPTKLYPDY